MTAPQEMTPAEKRKSRALIAGMIAIGLLIAVMLIGPAIWGAKKPQTVTTAPQPVAMYSLASDACESAVRGKMKDAKSARFEWTGVHGDNSNRQSGVWNITGKVTGKNSYGQNVTQPFVCEVTYKNGTPTTRASID